MNLIEGWGTGIPKLFREMSEYGLREPEFEDMEIALRVNLYRYQTDIEPEAGIDIASGTNQEISKETSQEIEPVSKTDQETSQEIEIVPETNQEIELAPETDQENSQETSQEIKTALKTDQEIRFGNNIKIKTQDRIICEIRKNPFVTQKQLMEATGLSRSGVRYAMKKLQDRGLLERVGSTKKGQWVIKE